MEKENSLIVVILAAGKGNRMKSDLPKVCHSLAGMPMLTHVLTTAKQLNPKHSYIVYGHGAEEVIKGYDDEDINWIQQTEQLGTAHAVAQVLPHLKSVGQILVLFGDVPLISSKTLKRLIDKTPSHGVGMVVGVVDNPKGLGRILRDKSGNVYGIIEEKDATDDQKTIKEIFSGIMIFPSEFFTSLWPNIKNNNAQGEYYLTDLIAHSTDQNKKITIVSASFQEEILGVNTLMQLTRLDRFYQTRLAEELMNNGVMIRDPKRLDIRGSVDIDSQVEIDVNVVMEGKNTIKSKSYVGPNTFIKNSTIGKNVIIKANSYIEGVTISDNCVVGPYARLRPGTVLQDYVKIGNFVEVKNAKIDKNSKVSHLSYIGDAIIGKNVNVGAGTITCNYDGANKHQTIIEDDVFIGSDTQLIAPVTIGKGSTIAAGTTLTDDAPSKSLVLSRVDQKVVSNWKRAKKKES